MAATMEREAKGPCLQGPVNVLVPFVCCDHDDLRPRLGLACGPILGGCLWHLRGELWTPSIGAHR
jgi:hypothetical protein